MTLERWFCTNFVDTDRKGCWNCDSSTSRGRACRCSSRRPKSRTKDIVVSETGRKDALDRRNHRKAQCRCSCKLLKQKRRLKEFLRVTVRRTYLITLVIFAAKTYFDIGVRLHLNVKFFYRSIRDWLQNCGNFFGALENRTCSLRVLAN